MGHIYCLKVKGISLSPHMSEFLFHTCQEMMSDDSKKRSVCLDWIQANISTSYALGQMGSACGFIFFAEINTPAGLSASVEFIVQPVKKEEDWRSMRFLGSYIGTDNEVDVSRN